MDAIPDTSASAAPPSTRPPVDVAVEMLTKKQRKKLRRQEERASGAAPRAVKKRKSSRDAKFATPAPKYSFHRGYRTVEPYVYEFRTFAKERWFSRELLEIFTTEFGAYSPEYYRFAIASGRISVNHDIVDPATRIKNGDLIIHKAHRHEPPVSGEEVQIVHEDDDVMVVSKPPSIPTHPCGAYRQNSLHSIVQAMRPELPQLHIVHRLDRLTSGIVLLAKTPAKAKALSLCIADREASKTYLARVRASDITFVDEHTVRISCPLRCQSARDGVWECHADGKPSETLVHLLRKPDAATSVVQCKPVTGRTHQIRLHLQLIGFPIANDPCYGGELHYGETAARLSEIAAATEAKDGDTLPAATKEVDLSTPRQEDESEDDFMRRTCTWCRVGDAEAFNETQLHCSRIWLHALEYKLDGHVFQVPAPAWAAQAAAN